MIVFPEIIKWKFWYCYLKLRDKITRLYDCCNWEIVLVIQIHSYNNWKNLRLDKYVSRLIIIFLIEIDVMFHYNFIDRIIEFLSYAAKFFRLEKWILCFEFFCSEILPITY